MPANGLYPALWHARQWLISVTVACPPMAYILTRGMHAQWFINLSIAVLVRGLDIPAAIVTLGGRQRSSWTPGPDSPLVSSLREQSREQASCPHSAFALLQLASMRPFQALATRACPLAAAHMPKENQLQIAGNASIWKYKIRMNIYDLDTSEEAQPLLSRLFTPAPLHCARSAARAHCCSWRSLTSACRTTWLA